MKRLIAALALVFALGAYGTAQAQTPPVTASYVAGWNMVGGPVGTDLSPAAELATWSSSAYVSGPAAITQPCQGYWAYFTTPVTVTLPPNTGPTQTCPLQAGWNIVGNPFSGVALLPAGDTAWYWDPSRGAYDTVSAIPPGGSVWIISNTGSAITLTYLPASSGRVPTTAEIDFLPANPISIHVGDSIKLSLPLNTLDRAAYDPAYLHLDTAGETGDLSCLSDPSCAGSLLSQFWIWHATAPGYTTITVTAVCPGPGTTAGACPPSSQIMVTILP